MHSKCSTAAPFNFLVINENRSLFNVSHFGVLKKPDFDPAKRLLILVTRKSVAVDYLCTLQILRVVFVMRFFFDL